MKKYHDMQSVFSIAFLYLSVQGIISLVERLVLIPLDLSFNYNSIVTILNFVILTAVILYLVKKLNLTTLSHLRNLFDNDHIRVTSGYLLLINSVLSIFKWIPSAILIVYNYFNSMPTNNGSFPAEILKDIIDRYNSNFQKNSIIKAITLLFNIINLFAGIYMTYLYEKRNAQSVESGEADDKLEG